MAFFGLRRRNWEGIFRAAVNPSMRLLACACGNICRPQFSPHFHRLRTISRARIGRPRRFGTISGDQFFPAAIFRLLSISGRAVRFAADAGGFAGARVPTSRALAPSHSIVPVRILTTAGGPAPPLHDGVFIRRFCRFAGIFERALRPDTAPDPRGFTRPRAASLLYKF